MNMMNYWLCTSVTHITLILYNKHLVSLVYLNIYLISISKSGFVILIQPNHQKIKPVTVFDPVYEIPALKNGMLTIPPVTLCHTDTNRI